MSTSNHITLDDLILLALQFLPEAETPKALDHVDQCAECRDELARIQGDLAAFAWGVEMHSPPAYARERLLRRMEEDKKIQASRKVPVAATAGGRHGANELYTMPDRRGAMMKWAGWAVAAGMTLVAGFEFTQRQHAEDQMQAQQKQLGDSLHAQDVLQTLTDSRTKQVDMHLASEHITTKNPEAHAAYRADTGALVFFASNLQPLQPYKTYELWLLPANGHDPIAAGLFKPDANGSANVMMPNLPKGVPASGFGITIEDEAGAKQPTLPIVMTGA